MHSRVPVQFRISIFFSQEKVDDERSDKDETDESEDEEDDKDDKINTKKNGPVLNGHAVYNNNHRKTE